MRPVVLHPGSLAIALAAMLATGLGLLACSGEQKGVGTIDAFVMAQEFAKGKMELVSPGSAKWPYFYGDDATCRSLGNDRFQVNSYVDSQNYFGALLRTHYRATLVHNGGGNWTLEKFALGEQASQKEVESDLMRRVQNDVEALEEGDIAELKENTFANKAWNRRPWGGTSIEAAEKMNFADESTAESLVHQEQVFRLEAGTKVILLRQDGSEKGFYKWVSVASEGPHLGRTLVVASGHLTELQGQAAMSVREKIMERARESRDQHASAPPAKR